MDIVLLFSCVIIFTLGIIYCRYAYMLAKRDNKIVKKLKLLAVELKLANRRLGKKQMEICLLSMVTFFP